MSVIPGTGKVGLSGQIGRLKFARAYYDFAVDGGAVGAITLRGDTIPSGAFVLGSYVDVDTAVTSGGSATVSIGVQSATDVRAADTLATAPALSTTGAKVGAITPATSPTETTAVKSVVATVAVAALTAGKFSVILSYIELT